ncbi:hypothetical protein [Vibrio owensii]|uniref:hypothetical protein n=1 Tax=Vibrio owensii TaxID=696485 RepID=UPI00140517D8|nr:hypothetical protein [Vibrio owensii]
MFSDSSALQAYVMTHGNLNQQQAQAWLDKWTPHWRTEAPNEPISIIEQDGDDDDE